MYSIWNELVNAAHVINCILRNEYDGNTEQKRELNRKSKLTKRNSQYKSKARYIIWYLIYCCLYNEEPVGYTLKRDAPPGGLKLGSSDVNKVNKRKRKIPQQCVNDMMISKIKEPCETVKDTSVAVSVTTDSSLVFEKTKLELTNFIIKQLSNCKSKNMYNMKKTSAAVLSRLWTLDLIYKDAFTLINDIEKKDYYNELFYKKDLSGDNFDWTFDMCSAISQCMSTICKFFVSNLLEILADLKQIECKLKSNKKLSGHKKSNKGRNSFDLESSNSDSDQDVSIDSSLLLGSSKSLSNSTNHCKKKRTTQTNYYDSNQFKKNYKLKNIRKKLVFAIIVDLDLHEVVLQFRHLYSSNTNDYVKFAQDQFLSKLSKIICKTCYPAYPQDMYCESYKNLIRKNESESVIDILLSLSSEYKYFNNEFRRIDHDKFKTFITPLPLKKFHILRRNLNSMHYFYSDFEIKLDLKNLVEYGNGGKNIVAASFMNGGEIYLFDIFLNHDMNYEMPLNWAERLSLLRNLKCTAKYKIIDVQPCDIFQVLFYKFPRDVFIYLKTANCSPYTFFSQGPSSKNTNDSLCSMIELNSKDIQLTHNKKNFDDLLRADKTCNRNNIVDLDTKRFTALKIENSSEEDEVQLQNIELPKEKRKYYSKKYFKHQTDFIVGKPAKKKPFNYCNQDQLETMNKHMSMELWDTQLNNFAKMLKDRTFCNKMNDLRVMTNPYCINTESKSKEGTFREAAEFISSFEPEASNSDAEANSTNDNDFKDLIFKQINKINMNKH